MMYSRVANRIQNSLLINDLIKSDKPVIFLVSEEQQIEKENLFGFAHLFMGEKITVDEENEYPIYKPFDKKGIKEHILSLSVCEKLVKSIQII